VFVPSADFTKEASSALPPVVDSSSGRYVHSEVEKHKDGVSGFRLLTVSTNALMSRLTLIDHATRSVDLQYYIFANDATGRLVAQRLLAAADRGVRVRLLIDHVGVDDKEHLLDALDAHENIEVRSSIRSGQTIHRCHRESRNSSSTDSA
jgi:putative cardiolipin synthase